MRDFIIPGAIAVAGILIAGGVYIHLRMQAGQEPSTVSPTADLSLIPPVTSADHILGNPAAPVVIIEYSDFDCPFCKQFHDTLHQLMASYGTNGDVAWVMREFPLTELHPNAAKHAEAAECVARVGGSDAFWKFGDLLFGGQPTNPSAYPALLAKVGVDSSQFDACMSQGDTATLVAGERQDALSAGAQGTPFSVLLVKGHTPVAIPGALPLDQLKTLVDNAIQSTK
ncbi:MAG: DsbA family protein [Patescibacteria group bacterium]|nr:thioredoxin domain-containing protein [Patescibacteria group bacterium]MDE1966356.1 DsbA family protein [Patescibacteria group bacterium]